MTTHRFDRRDFIKHSAYGAAGITVASAAPLASEPPPPQPQAKPRIRFSVIGLNHGHINSMSDSVIRGGGELVAVYAKEPDLLAAFTKRFPHAKTASSEREILEDKSIQLIASASIPDERAPLGIRVMQHGKDFMVDKPGIITLEQLAEVRRVQAADEAHLLDLLQRTAREPRDGQGRRAGQGGRDRPGRADDRPRSASRQPLDAPGVVLGSDALRRHHLRHRLAPARPVPLLHRLDDGRSRGLAGRQRQPPAISRVRGFWRCDGPRQRRHWLHPRGLVHARWATDLGRRPADDPRHRGLHRAPEVRRHRGTSGRQPPVPRRTRKARYIDCKDVELPYGKQLVDDVLNRTETAMPQAHCFLATELALKAQKQARQSSS